MQGVFADRWASPAVKKMVYDFVRATQEVMVTGNGVGVRPEILRGGKTATELYGGNNG